MVLADGGPAARHHVARARVCECPVILLLETAERVGDRVCSDHDPRAEEVPFG